MLEIAREPYVSLFIIMFFGILLSKLEIKKIGFGSSGIVLSAIFFGYFGLRIPPSIEKIGLILFIFAVGIQAGPGFFESFKTGEARQYLKSTVITLFIVGVITVLVSMILGFNPLLLAGLFSGVTTSTPTLAAIVENSSSNVSLVTYAISYPVSLVTTIFSMKFLFKILKIDVAKEEAQYRKDIFKINPEINTKNFYVNNPNVYNKSIKDLNFNDITKSIISRVQRLDHEASFVPTDDTLLKENDLVKVIGDKTALKTVSLFLGEETDEQTSIPAEETLSTILITRSNIIGKPLSYLNLDGLWGAEIREIRRAGVNIIPTGATRLRFGDKILASVKKESESNLVKMLGGVESDSIDFLPISVAILLGVLIGQITITVGGTSLGPGMTGGILFTTLILGHVGKTGPMIWSIAGKTNQFLRQIGIMFFLCGVGSSTGETLMKSLTAESIKTILATVFITVTSIALTSIVSIKYLKMNKLRFLGALGGSFTCSASLPSSEDIKNSTIPLTAYSVTYPFALLLTILMGQIILFF